MEKLSAHPVPQLIRAFQIEAERIRRLRAASHALHDLARQMIDRPDEIIDWAKRDRRWSFTLAEMIKEPGRRPDELAARLLVAIVDALDEERELLGDDPEALAVSRYVSAVQAD